MGRRAQRGDEWEAGEIGAGQKAKRHVVSPSRLNLLHCVKKSMTTLETTRIISCGLIEKMTFEGR